MRPDVVQWIDSCSECSRKKRKEPEKQTEAGGSESLLQALRSPQIHDDLDRYVCFDSSGNHLLVSALNWQWQ